MSYYISHQRKQPHFLLQSTFHITIFFFMLKGKRFCLMVVV